MSEGEFKKRIGKIQSFKETEKIQFISMINEAAKDFPDSDDFWVDASYTERLFREGDYQQAVNDWFKKWFGSKTAKEVEP